MEKAELESKLVSMIRKATDFRKSQRDKEYLNNRAHFEGLQWNLAENKNNSPFLLRSDINHLKNAVTLRLGSLCADKYWGELQPLSPNDVEKVKNLNILYKNEWNRLKADQITEAVIKNGAICDNGYVQINYDQDKIIGGTMTRREGAITLNVIDTANVYLDPSATSIDDCNYYVVKMEKSKDWIEVNKPDWLRIIKENNIKTGSLIGSDSGNIYTGRNYGSSQSDCYQIETVYKKELIDVEIDITDEITGEATKEKVKRIQVIEYVLIGDKLIETNDKYPFDEFPIIPFQWEPEPQSPYGIPLLRGLTIPQKVANLIESAANNIAMHYTIPSYVVSEESGINIEQFARLNNGLGMVWQVAGDPSKAIRQLDPPAINEQLIGIKESFVQNIFSYAGITETYVGNIGTAGSTAEGTSSAINRATIIDNPVLAQIETFVEKLSRMIVKFMARYYKGQKVYIRDIEKSQNSYEFNEVEVSEDYNDLNFEFYVDLASRSKTDKNRQYNLLKDLYTTQNQYKEDKKIIGIPDLVKAARLDNYDEMFKRYKDISEEAFSEKADLIVQIMSIGQTTTPNGEPLISAEDMQQGIMDVLDDNGDLSSVQQIFQTYEEYQTAITELQNKIQLQQQNQDITQLRNITNEQNELIDNISRGYTNMMQNPIDNNSQ